MSRVPVLTGSPGWGAVRDCLHTTCSVLNREEWGQQRCTFPPSPGENNTMYCLHLTCKGADCRGPAQCHPTQGGLPSPLPVCSTFGSPGALVSLPWGHRGNVCLTQASGCRTALMKSACPWTCCQLSRINYNKSRELGEPLFGSGTQNAQQKTVNSSSHHLFCSQSERNRTYRWTDL